MKTTAFLLKVFIAVLGLFYVLPIKAQSLQTDNVEVIRKNAFKSNLIQGKITEHQLGILSNQVSSGQSAKIIIELKSDQIGKPGVRPLSAINGQAVLIQQLQDAFLNAKGIGPTQKVKRFKHMPFLALEADETILQELMQSDDVLSINIDKLNQLNLDQSIPYINADSVWSEGYTGDGQVVAVLDTGVDAAHEFLADPVTGSKVISEACFSTTYAPFSSVSLCADGSTTVGSGANCSGYTGCGHGTHVAGIAAGNGAVFSGVAKDARIIAIQVFSGFHDSEICGSNSCILAYDSDIIRGLERVYSLANDGVYSVASVNLSLGGGGFTSASDCDIENVAVKQAIDNLLSVGVPTVIASGNDGFPDKISTPGCISSAVSVGASSINDGIVSFSNGASWLSLVAPGQSINSSTPNDGYSSWNGTSMATPHVAGAFALLKSKLPSASVGQLFAALVNTGYPLTDSGSGFSTPRIQLGRASDALGLNNLPVNIVLDNDFHGVTVQGTFDRVGNTEGYKGSVLEGVGAGTNSYRFTPTITQSGNYRVLGWWSDAAANANNVVFTIRHDGGDEQVLVNQQLNGSQWNEFGVFYFTAGSSAYVEVSDVNGAVAIADAVRFEFIPVTIDTNVLPGGVTGTQYSYSLSANGGLAPYQWIISSGALADGLSLQSNGSIIGTPTQSGSFDFVVQVTDGLGYSLSKLLSINISGGSTVLAIETSTLADANVGVAYGVNLIASGGVEPYNWSLFSGNLPDGLTLQANGLISGTPTVEGNAGFTVQVTDDSGNSVEQALTLTVNSTTNIVFDNNFNNGDVTNWSQLLSGFVELYNDPLDGYVLRKTGNNDPNGGWSSLSNAISDFELTFYLRKVNESGGNSMRYSMTNGNGEGYGIKLKFTDGALNIERRSGWSGSSISSTVKLTGGLALNQWYTLRFTKQGENFNAEVYIGKTAPETAVPDLQISASNSTYSTFSQINIHGGYDYDTDDIRIKDLAISAPLTIETVNLTNGVVGSPYSVNLTANGGVSPYTWSITSGSLPSGLSLQSNGAISGTPDSYGVSNFTVMVTDGENATTTQNLQLTVENSPLGILTTTLPNGQVGAAYTVNLQADGGEAPYSWSVTGSLPSGLALNSSGLISGTPDSVGSVNFTVQVTDNNSDTATQALTITVNSSGSVIFEDDFENGVLAPWNQLLSGSVELFDDPTYGGVMRKVGNNDPDGGWAAFGQEISDFDLVLFVRKPNENGGRYIRYSLTDVDGNGYGVKLKYSDGTLNIERRNGWSGSVISNSLKLPGGMALNDWYTLRLVRQGETLTAYAYIGRADPYTAAPTVQVNASHSAYSSFSQININGGYEFDTDNLRISN